MGGDAAGVFVLRLQYAMLLSVLVGLSVVVPYVGATVVTFPWCWSPGSSGDGADFLGDGRVSDHSGALMATCWCHCCSARWSILHPIAIIVAILVFGGPWGFWGVLRDTRQCWPRW